MNCEIVGSNVKLFTKALHTIAKIGDEIFFEARQHHFMLSSINLASTEYGCFKVPPSFFSKFRLEDCTQEETSEESGVEVKMKAKPLCKAFKSGILLDKSLESCSISLESNPSKIRIHFVYKNRITRMVNIWLMAGDAGIEVNSLDFQNFNKIVTCSTVLSQALANFNKSDTEITFCATPDRLIIRNYMDEDDVQLYTVRSQLSLSSSEFECYEILKNTTMTIPSRAFRAAVQFAEAFNRQIAMVFTGSSNPVIIEITKNDLFQAKFLLATMNDVPDTQTTCSSNAESFEKEQSAKGVPVEVPPSVEDNAVQRPNIPVQVELPPTVHRPAMMHGRLNDSSGDELNEPNESKRIKLLFQRCLDPTFNELVVSDEEILAPNSDPECEALMD